MYNTNIDIKTTLKFKIAHSYTLKSQNIEKVRYTILTHQISDKKNGNQFNLKALKFSPNSFAT